MHAENPLDAPLTPDESAIVAADEATLRRLGYQQELLRRMSGFSNYAISLSIICILAGGITSFSQGFCSVGGASIGLGWPLVCLFSLVVAATMGQVASAFPTAGGLYHWASILGGRGWGWATAWFNLAGLIAVMAAIDVGMIDFVLGYLGVTLQFWPKWALVALLTYSHALLNHRGIRTTTLLTDFSGYWILGVSVALTFALLFSTHSWDLTRLVTFTNYSGPAGGGVWPEQTSLPWLFALGFLLPAYTLTGFDASAHVSEETVGASVNVPRGIVRSVLVSGVFGWVMLCVAVLAIPDLDSTAAQGGNAFSHLMKSVLPPWLAWSLFGGIAVAQYLCGLATVTSTSRMMYAFARDGGLPGSRYLKQVSPVHRTPVWSIWVTATSAVVLTAAVPYATIAAGCAVLLYISYVLPTFLGLRSHGRTWTRMGPWHLGPWYKPLAVVAILGTLFLLVIGMQPPNDQALWIVAGSVVLLLAVWFGWTSRHFQGPPRLEVGPAVPAESGVEA